MILAGFDGFHKSDSQSDNTEELLNLFKKKYFNKNLSSLTKSKYIQIKREWVDILYSMSKKYISEYRPKRNSAMEYVILLKKNNEKWSSFNFSKRKFKKIKK